MPLFAQKLKSSVPLTSVNPALDRMVSTTHAGQAHWAGTGPPGEWCRNWAHWASPGRSNNADSFTPRPCAKYKALTGDTKQKLIPHDAKACRHFKPRYASLVMS
jgi:hypothetical protein